MRCCNKDVKPLIGAPRYKTTPVSQPKPLIGAHVACIAQAHKEATCNSETNKQQIIMVRGAQSKNDSTEIDDLFRLTTSDWVSNQKSKDRREIILNNEWSKAGLQSATKDQYRVALRKWRRYTLQDISVGHAHQMRLVLPAFRYEAMMKSKDQAFTSLQDSDEKLCGFLDWVLDAIEVHNGSSQQKSVIAPSQQLEHAVQALSCVEKCQMGIAGQDDGCSDVFGPAFR